ncbi:MAG: TonB-dependent receptor [Paludibacter sp.]|nr:TonB-dependent receptor [Paludibacter sp.]
MKSKIFLFLVFTFLVAGLQANVRGKVSDTKGESIIGANVYLLNTTSGVVSDADGNFEIPENRDSKTLVISNVAYQSDTLEISDASVFLNVILKEVSLAEVSVVQKGPGLLKSRTAVIQTEKINKTELFKAACCNLSESFETNPSVDASYSDAATGARQIKLLGLSGDYVQMMTENIPNLRGISSLYGLNYIPGTWMNSIQVSKGTASVINGYEAITGQINVEYKKENDTEIVGANVYGNDAGRVEANANAAIKINENLSTGILAHYSDDFIEIDNNRDNFMDMPMVRQYNFANRWRYEKNNYHLQVFLRGLSEMRKGGQIDGDYHIDIDTKRYEFFTKNGFILNPEKERSLGIIFSGSLHTQNSNYAGKTYNGNQKNLYLNLIYATNFGKFSKITTGASVNFDKYNEIYKLDMAYAIPVPILRRDELVSGAFAEYTFNVNDKFIALAGLRGDYNSLYNRFFITPRLHLKYNVNDYLYFRATAGKGYRSPNVLAEKNNLLASSRDFRVDNDLKMEEAWNYGISAQSYIPLWGRELSLSAEWYYTDFVNQVIDDMDSNPHEIRFSNLAGKSFSNVLQFEANMEVVKGLTLTAAHRITNVKTTIGGVLREKALTNRSKSLLTASYQTPLKKWQFDFTAQFNGGGRLPDADAEHPLWDKEFKPYTILNAQITKYFRTWSVYAGSENIGNFVQTNPIIDAANPFGADFDATMIWGPVHGRKIYVGLRWALER